MGMKLLPIANCQLPIFTIGLAAILCITITPNCAIGQLTTSSKAATEKKIEKHVGELVRKMEVEKPVLGKKTDFTKFSHGNLRVDAVGRIEVGIALKTAADSVVIKQKITDAKGSVLNTIRVQHGFEAIGWVPYTSINDIAQLVSCKLILPAGMSGVQK
ncbi:MAG TPA: hypothetical protein VKS81_10705 [Bacteroidota bacterium]|nr:hypothetical protein [Bacteroidota bacterium]